MFERSRMLSRWGVAGFLALMGTAKTQAAIVVLTASLNGLQEVPSNASPGIGNGVVFLDDVANTIIWRVESSGLIGARTDAHFHGNAPPGVNAGVQVSIAAFSGLGPVMDRFIPVPITAAQAGNLQNGLWYINIHTTAFPGGEIRGQLNVVPEPSSIVLCSVGVAVGGVVWLKRRRKTAAATE